MQFLGLPELVCEIRAHAFAQCLVCARMRRLCTRTRNVAVCPRTENAKSKTWACARDKAQRRR